MGDIQYALRMTFLEMNQSLLQEIIGKKSNEENGSGTWGGGS